MRSALLQTTTVVRISVVSGKSMLPPTIDSRKGGWCGCSWQLSIFLWWTTCTDVRCFTSSTYIDLSKRYPHSTLRIPHDIECTYVQNTYVHIVSGSRVQGPGSSFWFLGQPICDIRVRVFPPKGNILLLRHKSNDTPCHCKLVLISRILR